MKRYAVKVEIAAAYREMNPDGARAAQAQLDKNLGYRPFLSFRTRFFAKRDMRMLAATRDGIMDFVLVDQETGEELMRA